MATHAPAWQNGVAPPHATPHAPQLAGSLATLVHAPLHDCFPDGHAHLPFAHASPFAHAVPHFPQLALSFVVSTHFDPHNASPIAHADWQLPLEHTRLASHACPHDPQFFPSLARSRHAVPHAVCPVAHVGGGGGTQSPAGLQVSPLEQSELLVHVTFLPPQLSASAIDTARRAPRNRIARTFRFMVRAEQRRCHLGARVRVGSGG